MANTFPSSPLTSTASPTRSRAVPEDPRHRAREGSPRLREVRATGPAGDPCRSTRAASPAAEPPRHPYGSTGEVASEMVRVKQTGPLFPAGGHDVRCYAKADKFWVRDGTGVPGRCTRAARGRRRRRPRPIEPACPFLGRRPPAPEAARPRHRRLLRAARTRRRNEPTDPEVSRRLARIPPARERRVDRAPVAGQSRTSWSRSPRGSAPPAKSAWRADATTPICAAPRRRRARLAGRAVARARLRAGARSAARPSVARRTRRSCTGRSACTSGTPVPQNLAAELLHRHPRHRRRSERPEHAPVPHARRAGLPHRRRRTSSGCSATCTREQRRRNRIVSSVSGLQRGAATAVRTSDRFCSETSCWHYFEPGMEYPIHFDARRSAPSAAAAAEHVVHPLVHPPRPGAAGCRA